NKRAMERDFAKQFASGKQAKQEERVRAIEGGLGTLEQMKGMLGRGKLGKGSGFSALFSPEVRRDRAEFEQLGRSLIPLVSAGVSIRNQKEFEEYKKIITDPSAYQDEIAGAIAGLESLLSRTMQMSAEDHPLAQFDLKKKEPSRLAKEEESPIGDDVPFHEVKGPEETKAGPSRLQSFLSATPKGAIKSLESIGELLNIPVDSLTNMLSPELAERKKKFKTQREEWVEKALPTLEGPVEDMLQFAGEQLPFVATGPGGALAKGGAAFAGGLAKKGAKEVGLPEWAQDLASGVGIAAPGLAKAALSKVIKPSAAQKEVVDFLRSKGLSEKQITPIIQDEKKLAALSKVAFKYPEKSPFIREIRDNLGSLYEQVYSKGAQKALGDQGLSIFTSDLNKALQSLNPRYRDALKKEVELLFSEPITFKSLAEFEHAANDALRGMTGGKRSIGVLKDVAKKTMKYLDPALSKEHEMVNKSYAQLANFTEHMTKKQADSFLKLEKINPGIAAAVSLNFAAFPKLGLTAAAAPYVARKFLTSPRLQRLHAKMFSEMEKGKVQN